jgi:LacI family transcriptional regulator
MMCSAERGPQAEIEHLRQLRDYHAAGIVFAGSGRIRDADALELEGAVAEARERGAVVVALAQRDFPVPAIVFDNEAAAYDLTSYVRSLGHRTVVFIEGPRSLHTSAQRLAGFKRAGGTDSVPGGFAYEDGIAAAEHLLTRDNLPDAIVAANDEAAIGVLMRLREAGVRVPQDVSIAGIDDIRPARFVDLTTITAPLHAMGREAAQAILAGGARDRVVLPHRLAARGTTTRR